MISKWVRVLCMIMSVQILFGITTDSAQPSGLFTSNSVQIGQPEPNVNISPYITTSLRNKDIPTLLKRAGIPEKNIFPTRKINSTTSPLSEGDYQWHTFYGSTSEDNGFSIAADGNGGLYITGDSLAAWNGPAGQAPLHSFSGNDDITVLKLDRNGSYQWHTFYGSAFDDYGDGINVDGNGGVYITGGSLAAWNGPAGQAPLHSFSGNEDITVLKLDRNGSYQWHTFYGSALDDYGAGINMDSLGGVYIAGYSLTTWNGPAGQAPLHSYSGYYDITVLKLDSSGAYQWHTFYGSTLDDEGYGMTVDSLGGVYITGVSSGSWNGPYGQVPLNPYSGGGLYNITVLKLDSSGAYQWHTFYGSNSSSYGYAIALDGNGSIYISGSSDATWNGPDGQAPLHSFSDWDDITVLKLDSSGAYQWHTFYGSTTSDLGYNIALDGIGGVYITGLSGGSWNGPYGQVPLNPYSGGENITVLKLDSTGAYQWHTFYGSNSINYGYAVALDGNGSIYISGSSNTTWNGPDGQAPLHSYSGGIYDICVLMLRGNYLPVNADFIASPTEGIAPQEISFTNTSTGDFTDSLWDFGDGISSTLESPTHTYTIGDAYTVTLTVSGLGGSDTEIMDNYITIYTPVIANFSAEPSYGIAPLDVAFTNLSSGDYATSLWDFGDGITSTLENPTHLYSVAGVYTVTLSVSGLGGADEERKIGYITIQPRSIKTYLPLVIRETRGLNRITNGQSLLQSILTVWRKLLGS